MVVDQAPYWLTESGKFQSHMNSLAIPMLVETPFVESEPKYRVK